MMSTKLGGITVSALQERTMLNILNGIDEAALSTLVQDDPSFGKTPEQGAYGLRLAYAKKALAFRKMQPTGEFPSVASLLEVKGIGKDTFRDFVATWANMAPAQQALAFINFERDPAMYEQLLVQPDIEEATSLIDKPTARELIRIRGRQQGGRFTSLTQMSELTPLDLQTVVQIWRKFNFKLEPLVVEQAQQHPAVLRGNLANDLRPFLSGSAFDTIVLGSDSLFQAVEKIGLAADPDVMQQLNLDFGAALEAEAVDPNSRVLHLVSLPQVSKVSLAPLDLLFDPAAIPGIPLNATWYNLSGPTSYFPCGAATIWPLVDGAWGDPLIYDQPFAVEPFEGKVRVRKFTGGPFTMFGGTGLLLYGLVDLVRVTCDAGIIGEAYTVPDDFQPKEVEELFWPPGWRQPGTDGVPLDNPALPPVGQPSVDRPDFGVSKDNQYPNEVIVGDGFVGVPGIGGGFNYGPFVFVVLQCSVMIDGCDCIRKRELETYRAIPNPEGGTYQWSVNDSAIGEIVGPNDQKAVRVRGLNTQKPLLLTCDYEKDGCTTSATFTINVIYQRFTPAGKPNNEKIALPLLQHAPAVRITSWKIQKVNENTQKVLLDQRKVVMKVDLAGTLKDAIKEIDGVEIVSGSAFRKTLPADRGDRFTNIDFKAVNIEFMAPGNSFIRTIGRNKLKRKGSDTIEISVVPRQKDQQLVAEVEEQLAEALADNKSRLVSAAKKRLRLALINAVDFATVSVGQIVHAQPGDPRPSPNDKFSIAVEDEAMAGQAPMGSSFEGANIPLKEQGGLLLPSAPPDMFILIDQPYNGQEYRFDNEGALRSAFGDATSLTYVSDCCALKIPTVAVRFVTRPQQINIKYKDPVPIEAVASPEKILGKKGRFTYEILARPDGADPQFGTFTEADRDKQRRLTTENTKTDFFADRTGIYTLKVSYEIGGITSPWTYDLVDLYLVVKKQFTARVERFGDYTSPDLAPHIGRPYERPRGVTGQPGAEIVIKSEGNASLGKGLRIDITCPREIEYRQGVRARATLTDDTEEDHFFTIDPKERFRAGVEIMSVKEITKVQLLDITYQNLQRREGDAVWTTSLITDIAPPSADLPAVVDATAPPFPSPSQVFVADTSINTPDPDGLLPESIPLVNLILQVRDLGDAQTTKGFYSISNLDSKVNLVNGNHYFNGRWFSTRGVGLNVTFDLHYNSLAATRDEGISLYGRYNGKQENQLAEEFGPRPFGHGWNSTLDLTLFPFIDPVSNDFERKKLQKKIEIKLSDGNRLVFAETAKPGVYHVAHDAATIGDEPDAALGLELTFQADNGQWQLDSMNRERWLFDERGRIASYSDLVSQKNTALKPMRWAWDTDRITVTDSAGRDTVITLQDGLARSVVQPDKATWQITFLSRQLRQWTNPENNIWSFDYGTESLMTKLTPPEGYALSLVHYRGQPLPDLFPKTQREYWGRIADLQFGDLTANDAEQVRDATIRYQERRPQQFVFVTDPEGHIWRYEYNTQRQAVDNVFYAAKENKDDFKLFAAWQYRFDTKRMETSTTFNFAITRYVYFPDPQQARGQLLQSVLLPETGTIEYEYDENARTTLMRDEDRSVTTYERNDDGQIKQINYPEVETILPDLTETTVKRIATYRYDNLGRLERQVESDGIETRYTYAKPNDNDKTGLPLTRVTGNFASRKTLTTTMVYDVMGRLKTTTNHYGFPTTNEYDKLGRIVKVSEGNGQNKHEVTFKYDKLDRQRQLIDQAAGANRVNKTKYSAFNEMVALTNALDDSLTIVKRDKRGQILQRKMPDGAVYTYKGYDPLGRVKGIVHPDVQRSSPDGMRTEKLFDQDFTYVDKPSRMPITNQIATTETVNWGKNRVVRTYFSLKGSPLCEETIEDGRIQRIINRYDVKNQLVEVTRYEDKKKIRTLLSYRYDTLGRKVQELGGNLLKKFAYNRDRQGLYRVEIFPTQFRQNGAAPHALERYDDNQRLVATYNGRGSKVMEYRYDDTQRTVDVWMSNPANNVTSTTLVQVRSIKHRENGDVAFEIDLRTGKKVTFERDNIGRITQSTIVHADGAEELVSYQYDVLDRRVKTTSMIESIGAAPGRTLEGRAFTPPVRSKKPLVTTQAFDKMGRLIKQGNQLSEENMVFDQAGQLTSVTRTGMGGSKTITETFFYNAKGDMTGRSYGRDHFWQIDHDFQARNWTEKYRYNNVFGQVRTLTRKFQTDEMDSIESVIDSNGFRFSMGHETNGRLNKLSVFFRGFRISRVKWDYGTGMMPDLINLNYSDVDRDVRYSYNANLQVEVIDDGVFNSKGAYKMKWNTLGLLQRLQRPADPKAQSNYKYHLTGKLDQLVHNIAEDWGDTFTTTVNLPDYDDFGNPLKASHAHTIGRLDRLTGEQFNGQNYTQAEQHAFDKQNRLNKSLYQGQHSRLLGLVSTDAEQSRDFFFDVFDRKVLEVRKDNPNIQDRNVTAPYFEIVKHFYGTGQAVEESIKEFYSAGSNSPNLSRKKFNYDDLGRVVQVIETLVLGLDTSSTKYARMTALEYGLDNLPIYIQTFELRGSKIQKVADIAMAYNPGGQLVYSRTEVHGMSLFGQSGGEAVVQGRFAESADFRIPIPATQAISSSTTHFVYAEDSLWAVLDERGNVIEDYLNGSGRNNHLALRRRKDDELGDPLDYAMGFRGSSLLLMDQSGEIQEDFRQTGTYGELNRQRQRVVHGAMVKEPGSAVFRTGIRNYDPDTQQFQAPDPMGMNAGSNVYAYGNNNPVSLTDSGEHPVMFLAYFLFSAGLAAVETGLELGLESLLNDGKEITWGQIGRTYTRNLAIGLLTNWTVIGPFTRIGGRVIATTAVRVGVKAGGWTAVRSAAFRYAGQLGFQSAIEYAVERITPGRKSSFLEIAVGNVGGDLASALLKSGTRGIGRFWRLEGSGLDAPTLGGVRIFPSWFENANRWVYDKLGGVKILSNNRIRRSKRDIIAVWTENGPQGFYRSTGFNSKRPGEWLPFDGIVPRDNPVGIKPGWIDKSRFITSANSSVPKDLNRLGTEHFKSISERLNRLQFPGKGELLDDIPNVNNWLREFGAYYPSFLDYIRGR